ncbi:Conserved_hypothetical protein [Hexamita inflata]|uniref:EGF-like domain-containing protein n=1 Tax=Hexamita inflata TaxID=28002 RepID=A0AA86QSK4_9EUKA|nr:Conserved hypothetical protein [Hexamita inflata]
MNTNQYYDMCVNYIIGMNQLKGQQKLQNNCNQGTIIDGGQCDTTSSSIACNTTNSKIMITDMNAIQKDCRFSCIFGEANNTFSCGTACQELTYIQPYFGNCLPCESVQYDNGTYWDRLSALCIQTCTYYNATYPKICEQPGNLTNCPKYIQDGAQFKCVKTCVGYYNFQTNLCVTDCVSPLPFIDETNASCTAVCTNSLYNLNVNSKPQCSLTCVFPLGLITGLSGYKQCVTCPVFVQRIDQSCSTTCNFRNFTNNSICEIQGNATNCPKYYNSSSFYICRFNCTGYYDAANECVSICPANLPFISADSLTCVAACKFYITSPSLKCVSSCAFPNGLYNNTAYQNNYSQCVTQCPNGMVLYRNDQHCDTSCAYISKRNATQFYCETKNDPTYCNYYVNISASQFQCLDSCASINKLIASDGHTCVDVCNNGEFVSSDAVRCQTTCPSGAYYTDPVLKCSPGTCPLGNLTNQYLTYTKCLTYCNKFISGVQCLDSCPNYEFQINTTDGLYYCASCASVSNSVYKPFSYLTKVHKQCYNCTAANEIIHSDKVCNLTLCSSETGNYIYTNINTCVTSCQFIDSISSLKCLNCSSKPNGFTTDTVRSTTVYICQAACPSDKPYYDSTTKVNITPQCVAKCPDSAKYLETDLTCTAVCVSNSFIVDTTKTQQYICQINSCPNYFITVGTQKQCVDACTPAYPYLDVKECKASCSFYSNTVVINSTQYYSCSTNCPLYFITDASNNKRCVPDCGSMFISGNECKATCAFYSYNGTNKTCLSSCGAGLFYGMDLTIDTTVQRCENSCSKITNKPYSTGQVCDSKCTGSNVYLDGTVCKTSCPFYANSSTPLISTYVCLTKCDTYYEIDASSNSHCVNSCAEANAKPYNNGYKCLAACNEAPNLLIQNLVCVQACTENRAISIDGKICAATCQFYTDNMGVKRCIASCNTTYPFQQLFSAGRYECVTECPQKQYVVVSTNKVCQLCGKYYEQQADGTQKCVDACQTGWVRLGDRCYNGLCKDISSTSKYSGTDYICSTTCGADFVKDQTSFQCIAQCPNGQVFQPINGEKSCVTTCSDGRWVSTYPSDVYRTVGQCVATCPAGTYKELLQNGQTNKFCVDACALKMYQVVGSELICVSTCPTYELLAGNVKRCYENCSQTTSNKVTIIIGANNNQCSTECPSTLYFLNTTDLTCRTQCVSKAYSIENGKNICQDSCQFYYIVDARLDKQCVPDCGSMFISGNECKATCAFYSYNGTNKTCLSSCGAGLFYGMDLTIDTTVQRCENSCSKITNKPYSTGQVCDSKCTGSNVYLDGTVCKTSCPFYANSSTPLISTYVCLTKCDTYYEIDANSNSHCVNSCAEANAKPYNNGYKCLAACNEAPNLLIQNLVCVQACTENRAISIDGKICDTTCQFYTDNMGVKRCIASCNTTYPFQQLFSAGRYECVTECPQKQYVVVSTNKVCQLCGKYYEQQADGTQKCVDACQTGWVRLGDRCYNGLCKDISSTSKYSGTDYICSTTCGADFVKDQTSFQCIAQCPNGQVFQPINGEKSCVTTCSDGLWVSTYPSDVYRTVGQCVATCPAGTYKELLQNGQTNKFCVDACALKMYQVVGSELICVSTCPTYELLAGNVKRCYENCSQTTSNKVTIIIGANNNQCSTECPSTLYFLNTTDLTCRTQCVSKAYSIENGKNICQDSCQFYYIVDARLDKQCVPDCGSMFISGNECKATCAFYSYNGTNKTCLSSCGAGLFYGMDLTIDTTVQRCENSCSKITNKPYSTGQVCDSKCTGSNVYLDGTVCKTSCPFYANSSTPLISTYVCLTKCDTYYEIDASSNSHCVNSCAEANAKPYNNGYKCLAACNEAPNLLIQNLVCVQACTENRAISIDGKICDTTCQFYTDNMGVKRCIASCNTTYPFQQLFSAGRYECVTECPQKQYVVVSTNKVCQLCGKYYEQQADGTQKCVDACQTGWVRLGDRCYNGLCKDISSTSKYSGTDYICSTTCGADFVKDQTSFQCIAQCPNGQVFQPINGEKSCVTTCSDGLWVSTYPSDVYRTVGQCVATCPAGTYKELLQNGQTNKFCVDACALKMYQVVGSELICVSTCPTYELLAGNVKRCYENCSLTANNHYTVIVSDTDKYCSNNCTPAQPFLDAATLFCTATCASKLYQVISGIPNCITECPLNTTNDKGFNTTDHTRCLGECSQSTNNLYVQVNANNTGLCVDKCPADHTFLNPTLKQCVVSCDPKFYITNDTVLTCVAKCDDPSLPDSVYNRPIPGIKDHTECAPNCYGSTPFKMPDNTCVALCPSGYFALDKTCVTACPADRKYIIDESLPDGVQQRCQAQCPKYFVISSTQFVCQDCDTASKYYQVAADGQKQCVDKCDDVQFYEEDHQCTAQCASKLHDGQKCVTKCPHVYEVIDSVGVCIDNCSLSTHGNNVHDAADGLVCIPSCTGQPVNFIEDVISGERTCVAACPLPKRLDNVTNKCDETCFYKIVNTVRICMDDHNSCDTWYEFEHGVNDTECRAVCTDYINGRKCQPACPNLIYTGSGSNKVCQQQCDTYWGYDLQINSTMKRCEQQCLTMNNLPFINPDTKQCLIKCPLSAPYADNFICKTSCPSGYFTPDLICSSECSPFIQTQNGRQCISECPKELPFTQNGKCVSACESPLLLNVKNCQLACPKELPFNQSGICVLKCDSGIFQNNICLDDLDNCTIFVTINGQKECVTTCQYLMNGKECVQVCPDHTIQRKNRCYPINGGGCDLYIERDKCVAKCSEGFYDINMVCTPKVRCAYDEIMMSDGSCAVYKDQIHTKTPAGDLMEVKCLKGTLVENLCIPFTCGAGKSWIISSCYESQYCQKTVDGICQDGKISSNGDQC